MLPFHWTSTGDTAVQVFLVRNGHNGHENFLLEGVGIQNTSAQNASPQNIAQNAGEQNSEPVVQDSETIPQNPEKGSAGDDTADWDSEAGLLTDAGSLIGEFMQQFYAEATFIPKQIMVQAMPPDAEVLAEWLGSVAGNKVEVRVPQTRPQADIDATGNAECRGISALATGRVGKQYRSPDRSDL